MTVATTQRILTAIDCPQLSFHKVTNPRTGNYFYFEFDDRAAGVYETRSVFVHSLTHMTLESWTHEGRELVRRCTLMLGTSHVARLANPPMVRGLA